MVRKLSVIAALAICSCMSALAAPITLSANLTGDPRKNEPDNLFINVSITSDTTSNLAYWTVDIASPLYSSAKLDEFYFNMATGSSYTFSGFDPTGWAITTSVNPKGGGNFSPNFLFAVIDPPGNPKAGDVTNSVNLTFTMTKTSGLFTAADFLNSAYSKSSADGLGSGQIGAHLQVGSGKSGFLLGNYSIDNGGDPVSNVPEPATLALVGMALLGMAASRRKRRG